MTVREGLINTIWFGTDPFAGFPAGLYKPDPQGWKSDHPYLIEAVSSLKPKIIVEVGVWKGGSSITLGQAAKSNALDACVISVDTWLGAWDHWINEDWFGSLVVDHGQPMLMKTFMTNVMHANLENYIVPMPLDSLNASVVLKARGIGVNLFHLDGAHDYSAVMSDLQAWWPLIEDGGMIIGDDYYTDGNWAGVRQAFDEFFGTKRIEHTGGKCRVMKEG